MKWLFLFSCLLTLSSSGLLAVSKDSFGRLFFEMRVTSVCTSDSGVITLTAVGDDDGLPIGLSLEIYGNDDTGRNPLDKQLRMPVYIRRTGENSSSLDSIVSQHYKYREGDTLFKTQGYQGILEASAEVLAKKGGRLFVADGLLEGSIGWSLEFRWDKVESKLTMFVSGRQE